MAKKEKIEKPWNEKSLNELNREDLIKHALSLNGEKAQEAINFLEKLRTRPLTDEEKEKERKKLKAKTKKKTDKKTGEKIDTGKPAYTDKKIEEILENKQVRIHEINFIPFKKEYCTKFYPDVLKSDINNNNIDINSLLDNAKAEIKAKL